jgi:transcriptional regulator with XRE-family HTH domain
MLVVVATKKPEDVFAEAIGSAMGRRNLSRTDLAERMSNLGYRKWSRQTVAEVIEGRRRILAAELYPLSFALEMPLPALVMPWTEAGPAEIELPSGVRLRYFVETRAAGSYGNLWNGNIPKIGPGDTFNAESAADR